MERLKKLFENLAKKANVDTTTPEFADFLTKLNDIELPEEVAVKMESNLYDIESAKNNYTLKQHFTALALNGVDSKVQEAMDELLEDDSIKAELLGIKSTPQRVSALARKIKELESAKAKADGKGDDGKAKKAQEEIDRLVNEFKAKEQKFQADLQAKENEKNEAISNFKEELFFSGLKFANDFDLETNQIVARQKINKALMEKGAKKIFNYQTGKFEIKRADDESLDYLDERNNKTSFEDFAKGVLTQHKLLAVTDIGASKPTPLQPTPTLGSGQIDTSKFDMAVEEAQS